MKIGIYKPYKKVYFFNDVEDYAGWSYEVTSVAKIFAEHNHEIYMLSDTDLGTSNIIHKNIFSETYPDKPQQYDRILYFCGTIEKNEQEILSYLRKQTNKLDLILTDLKLKPSDISYFDDIYTQSELYGKYNGLPEVVFYNDEKRDVDTSINNKEYDFYFGGTERNRVNDFFEYVWRPGHIVKGKSKLLNFNNRIGRSENFELWKKARYTITIADIDYNDIGFITPRYYDNIRFNVLGFVDSKYDKTSHCIKQDDWRRVKNYQEMLEKMNYLKENPLAYKSLLFEQQSEIKEEYISGEFTYRCLQK